MVDVPGSGPAAEWERWGKRVQVRAEPGGCHGAHADRSRRSPDASTTGQPTAGRRLIAIAGPPGAGKSTLAEALVTRLEAASPGRAALVPMGRLPSRQRPPRRPRLRARPQGRVGDVRCRGVRTLGADVARGSERMSWCHCSIARSISARANAGSSRVPRAWSSLEGNYLLFDETPWCDLASLFDLTIRLVVDEAELEARLMRRWRDHGRDAEAARRQVIDNDIPNGRRIARHALPADMTFGKVSDDGDPPAR